MNKKRFSHWRILLIPALLGLILSGCASKPVANDQEARNERNFNAPTLSLNTRSALPEVLDTVPLESLMERITSNDSTGRSITYLAFTDTEVGGIVFIDGVLHGTLSHRDAQTFYACRGYLLGWPNRYWADDAPQWIDSLLGQVRPASAVVLEFSGKSTAQSIKSVTSNPFLSRLRSLLGMGSNPLGIFNTLNDTHSDYQASEQFDGELEAMKKLAPGLPEARLASIAKPQDISFTPHGMVLSYPRHRFEYFIAQGKLRAIQQPATTLMKHTGIGPFYFPDLQWSHCTAQDWPQAAPPTKTPADQPAQPTQPTTSSSGGGSEKSGTAAP